MWACGVACPGMSWLLGVAHVPFWGACAGHGLGASHEAMVWCHMTKGLCMHGMSTATLTHLFVFVSVAVMV